MPRSAGTIVENNFVNGLVSEATALNFPENACTSASNCVFKETGEVTRRYGFDYESTYQLNSVTRSNSAVVEFNWDAAGGDGTVTFVVQQIGGILYFYRALPTNSLSAGVHATTVSLGTYQVSGAPSPNAEPCSFSAGKGYLFVTNKYCDPFYVTYTPSTDTLASSPITIQIRDLEGVDDGLEDTARPTTLSNAHYYNLRNQGWAPPVTTTSGAITDPIEFWDTNRTDFPSNVDIFWLMRNASGNMDISNIDQDFVGTTLAPKGRYVLDAFNQVRTSNAQLIADRANQTAPTSLTTKSAGYYRPSCVAFFAGRTFYAGVEAPGYAGEVYYSQIIERDEQFGRCFQTNDPTSETLSDLLDTDGGVIRVLDMGTVYKMVSVQKALIILASNGVWSISGSDVNSFKATDYTIKKISSIKISSGLSLVDALGAPIFWTEDGIWTVAYQQGDFSVVSISDAKIKTYFKTIPRESKRWAKGAYNSVDRIIQWIFASTEPATVDARYTYDSVLTLNTTTGSFSPWTIASATKTVNGIVACTGPTYNSFDTVIDASSDTVIDASSNTVTVTTSSDSNSIKFFVTKNVSGTTYNSTFALAENTTYLDWVSDSESLNYSSTFTSGYRVHADANRQYQANYVTFYLKDDTGSSAFVQGIWDYSNSTSSHKWTTAQQIYNSTPLYRDYRIRKIKIRGWGVSCQFKIYSATGVPFHVVGWSSFETANPLP